MNYWGIPGVPCETEREITILDHHIIQVVCDHFKVTRKELESKSRKRRVVYPRQLAFYLLSTMGRTSLKRLGATFKRDHTTVIHSRDTIMHEMRNNTKVGDDIAALKESIRVTLAKK